MESKTNPIPDNSQEADFSSPRQAATSSTDGTGSAHSPKLGGGDHGNNSGHFQENSEQKPEDHQEVIHTLESTSKEVDGFLNTLPSLKASVKPEEGVDEDKSASETLEIPGYVEKFLDLVEEKIAKHEGKGKWGQDPKEDSCFFDAVNRITRVSQSLTELIKSDKSQDGVLINRISSIHQRAMSFLEDEFRTILEENWKVPEFDHKHESGSDQQNPDPANINYPGFSDEIVSNLHQIANSMINGGHEFECCEIYTIARRTAIDESLNKVSEFEKVSIDEIQKMHWETLEKEITVWCKTLKQCSLIFFSGEHKLVRSIFVDHPSISDGLFSNLTRGVVIQLLNFAEGVAISKRSIEKLFKILDMYEALRDNATSIDSLFPEQCGNELKSEMDTVRTRLGEEAILIFSDLEMSIKNDHGKTPVPGGAVHPLTRYTLNYLRFSCDQYKDTLDQVFKQHAKSDRTESTQPNQTDQTQDTDESTQSPFTNQLIRVMDLLDSNLESKSKLYKDISLSCIFMMNNGRYILQKVKGSSEASQKLGETWIRKTSSELRNYHKTYQRETWTKLLGCLTHEGLMDKGKIVKPHLKERFKNFNSKFEEIHRAQSSWVVRDEQLKSELRVSISSVVIPAYRSFLGRFSQFLDTGRQTEKYIKFQPEDIEDAIDDLFEGNPTSMVKRK
ncbi:hypothetical protein ACFE04_006477 [Oxalis oulophora]